MKRILIITEDDLTGQRLVQLYNSLYGNEVKELYWCSIDIIDCRQESVLYPYRIEVSKLIAKAPHSFGNHVVQTSTAKIILKAQTCQDINAIIYKYKIDTILLPHFLYDEHRAKQYDIIIKNVKRRNRIEIIGLYV